MKLWRVSGLVMRNMLQTCLWSYQNPVCFQGKRRWLLIRELRKWGNFAISILCMASSRAICREESSEESCAVYSPSFVANQLYDICSPAERCVNVQCELCNQWYGKTEAYGLLRWTLKILIIFLHKICTMHQFVS